MMSKSLIHVQNMDVKFKVNCINTEKPLHTESLNATAGLGMLIALKHLCKDSFYG